MKAYKYFITISVLLLLLIASCSRKKNSFISRNLHAVGTEYNVLYNGNLALQAGLDQLEAEYVDNYWDILPVERMQTKTDPTLPGVAKSLNPNFERAEEKAVKAVQKHSMLINEEEVNPQIDEAYILLGKARYYDQRFIPALEAFNYILQFMPESNQYARATVWRERTNMRLENNETAINNLRTLLKEEAGNIEREDLAITNATLAQAFLNTEQIDSAIFYMNKATRQTRDRETQARYTFIAGQLIARAGQRDSAFVKFDNLIDLHRKIPRRYYINAFIEKIKLFNPATDDKVQLLETLNELEQNRENRPYLLSIYSRKAIYYESEDSIEGAIEYYNKSLRRDGKDDYLRGNNYAALGEISFNRNEYENAGKYYDSARTSYTARTPEFRLVRKKRENLEDVILYEGWRSSADSIFNVVGMSDEQRVAYYQTYIDELQAAEAREAELAEIRAAQEAQNQNAFNKINSINNNTPRGNAGPGLGTPTTQQARVLGPSARGGGSTFYFYNQQTVSRGKQDFRRKWGKRKLEDNWRRKNKRANLELDNDTIVDTIVEDEIRPEFTTAFYTDRIPQGSMVLDSIAKSRNFAYYQLGIIYKEKFKRTDLAVNRLTTLLDYDPEEKLLLPALYNLYLIYNEENLTGVYPVANRKAKAESIKNRILTEYPNTRYAQILRNPDAKLDDKSSPSAIYKKLYTEYGNGNYAYVITQAEKYIAVFNGDPIIPRLELLKAFAAGRLYGFEEYKRGIDYVAINFPNTEVGKSAIKLVNDAESLKIADQFQDESKLNSFKLLYKLPVTDKPAIERIEKTIQRAIKEEKYDFYTSIDVYSPTETLVVVHGLSTKQGAQGLGDLLAKTENNYNINQAFIPIADENYKIIQVYKSLDQYEKEML